MRKITVVRIAISVIATPFLVILGLNIEKAAEKLGYDLILASVAEGEAMSTFLSWALHPAMLIVAVGAISFTLGIWVDALMRRVISEQGSRAERLRRLGKNALELSEDILRIWREKEPSFLDEDGSDHALRLYARLPPIEFALENLKIETPNYPKKISVGFRLNHVAGYLQFVGQLLADGNLKDARAVARRILKATRPIIEAQKRQSPSDTPAKTLP